MRWIVFITFVLCAAHHVACVWPAAAVDPQQHENMWVRTVDGWERPSSWRITSPEPMALHPLVVASFELFTGLLALVGLSGAKNKSHPRDLVPAHAPHKPTHLQHADR